MQENDGFLDASLSGKHNGFRNCIILKIKFREDHGEKDRKIAINIFKSGDFNITGARSEGEIRLVVDHLCKQMKLKECITEDAEIKDINIRMIHAYFAIPYNIDLNKLFTSFKTEYPKWFSKYDRNVHPGVQLNIPVNNDKTVAIFIFGTGKLLLSGSRNEKELVEAYSIIMKHFDKFFSTFCYFKINEIKIKGKRGRKRKHSETTLNI